MQHPNIGRIEPIPIVRVHLECIERDTRMRLGRDTDIIPCEELVNFITSIAEHTAEHGQIGYYRRKDSDRQYTLFDHNHRVVPPPRNI